MSEDKASHEQIKFQNEPGSPALDTNALQLQLSMLSQQLLDLPPHDKNETRANLLLQISRIQLDLTRHEQAWVSARQAFNAYIALQMWQQAAESCFSMYYSEQPASVAALAHGTWLAVTFPMDIELSIGLLKSIIDDTPDHADGAAIAAMTAHYIVSMRATSAEQFNSMSFLTTQLISQVAARHSQVKTQQELDIWLKKLNIKEPQDFLPKLAKILDALTENKWWFDRDQLRQFIPN